MGLAGIVDARRKYLQDIANFHRSWAWQIVLSFNIGFQCLGLGIAR